MSSRSRTYNSIVNSAWGISASAVTILLNFAVRYFLVRELGEEINGINSLFQSIITMMVLMEMGIGSAMIIHLYEPLKNKKYSLVSSILIFYRKVYRWLALLFFIAGVIVTVTMLGSLVKSSIPLLSVRIFFVIFVCSISFDYLTYYKRSVLYADQKNRISSGATAISEILFRSLQILVMIFYHSYEIFLILLTFEKIFGNFLCNRYVTKHYPEINLKIYNEIGNDYKKSIYATVKPLMVNQTASSIQNSSTSVLIGLLLGNVSIVGYYGGYTLLTGVILLIYSQFGSAFTTSFGNLAVENNKEKMGNTFFLTSYLLNWLACICCSVLCVCAGDFLFIFFGDHFVLPQDSVVIIILNLVIYLLAIPTVSVQNAMGLHNLDAKWMILQTILVVFLGYLGGSEFGLNGILLSLTITSFVFMILIKGILVSKQAFEFSSLNYLRYMFLELFKIIVVIVVVFLICENFKMRPSMLSIILKAMVALLFSIFLPLILASRSQYNKEIIMRLKNVISINKQ